MNNNERGQIVVILAIALVAILGITALAVDGSMIYAERRDDQSTADSAALAAAQSASASATCAVGRSQAISTAQQYASQQEGVALVNDSTSPSRVEATCNADNTKLTIKVVVTSNTPTTFAKMVSRNQLKTTVESMSQVTFGSGTFAGGNRLVALGNTCDDNGGIYSLGGAKIDITGGGIYSGSCIKTDGSGYILSSTGPILYKGKGANTFYVGAQIEYSGAYGLISTARAPNFILIDPDVNISNF
jgi:Tfp pilus assembly protein PilX